MAVQNSLTRANKPAPFSAVISSEGYKKLINNALRDPKRANRFVASIVSAVSTNPALQECAPDSIVSAALLGESLGLSPSPQLGQYWLVPYDDKKRGCKKAQFQLGANGYKQLAMRTGQYKDLDVIEIRQGEYKGRDRETGKPVFEFIEEDDVRENLPVVGYMAYFELLNGFRKVMYWSKEKMLNHADRYSQAFSKEATGGKYPKVSFADYEAGNYDPKDAWKYSSPWYSGFSGMAEKTMIRQLLHKWGVVSTEFEKAYQGDMGAINNDGSVEYIDNDTVDTVQPEPIDVTPEAEPKADPETGEIFTEEEKAEIMAKEAAEAEAAQEEFFK